ncbi:MAG TPA: C1 family peptidase [Steroidobacteraceae bacterium]|nr:C1 family peptidase [Steroidobacteraceae bacterium]
MATSKVDVKSLAKAIAAQGANWQAGETSMTSLSAAERKARLGFEPPPGTPTLEEVDLRLQSGERPREAYLAAAAVGAPPSYDLRDVNGRDFVTPIHDQGNCGSCVSFGTCAVLETTLRVAADDPVLDVDLSEAHLFYCYGRSQGRNCGNGWFPEAALDCCKSGLAFEQSYPYTAGDQNCTGLDANWGARHVKLTGRQLLSGAAIKEWISTRGAVTGCFLVYDDFFAYKTGVYRHVSGALAGGHCVAIIGYDDAQSCWICKNSWGPAWGDAGFFRIAYGECGIDSYYGPHGAVGVSIVQQGAWSGWASQGGVLTSDIAVSRNADGRMEIFVRGTDNAVWHKWQVAPNSSWSGWASQGGVITSEIAVGRNLDGRLELFVRGTDNALWHKWQVAPSSGWSGWATQGGILTSNIAVAANADGRMEVFVRGTDNALWHKWQVAPNSGWSGWTSLGGVLTSDIAVERNADGRLEVFVRGTDNALWHKWQVAPNSGWSGWTSLGGVLTSNIAVGRNADGRLEAFVRGTDQALWHNWQVAPNGAWSGWASEGGVLTSQIALGRSPQGRLEAFVRGTDNALWHKWQVAPNGGWSGWASEGGVLTSNIAIGTNADGRLEAFVRGTDNALWHKWQVQVFAAPPAAEADTAVAKPVHAVKAAAAEPERELVE